MSQSSGAAEWLQQRSCRSSDLLSWHRHTCMYGVTFSNVHFLVPPGSQRWQQQQEGRTGGWWEKQVGEQPVQCAFIPAVPSPLHAGHPHPTAGLSKPQQAAVWEPILHVWTQRLVFHPGMVRYLVGIMSRGETKSQRENNRCVYNEKLNELTLRKRVTRWNVITTNLDQFRRIFF